MAHPEQERYVARIKDRFPQFFKGTRVLEVGSRNVNGSVRRFFENCDYVGIDCTAGRDVDAVCLAHEYRCTKPFDVVITCEALEHDPHLKRTMRHVLSMLRPGGLFVGTWASPTRQEHGTERSGTEIYGPDPTFYKGVSPEEFTKACRGMLENLEVAEHRYGFDVYAVGFRKA